MAESCRTPSSDCELPECQHRCCACGHAECSHANENVQPNCSDCDCSGFVIDDTEDEPMDDATRYALGAM
jgi:hypothetical protein